MSRYPRFPRELVQLRPIAERGHDLLAQEVCQVAEPSEPYQHPDFSHLIAAIRQARDAGHPVILMMGAHPIKLGLSRYLIDLMKTGIVTHVALNGAGIIHDFELSLLGGTSENVAKWIARGQFGLWQETSLLNDIIRNAAERDEGLGTAVGEYLLEHPQATPEISLCAAGWEMGIPVTSHVTMGGDIIHGMPNANGAALGRATDNDFLIFAESVRKLGGGVYLNVGTAVTGPEVFLKALSMARNVAGQKGNEVSGFTTAVFDLANLPTNFREGPPSKENPQYYFRPWKTLLCRTVSDQGRSYYFQGDHRLTIPTLWAALGPA